MKTPQHYQDKMAKWLLRAQEAATRKQAQKALRKFKKHQARYSQAYNEGIRED